MASETMNDIVEEMRRFAQRHWMHDEGQNIRIFADRLEAAWRRDKYEIEADALTVGGFVEASHKRACAKMREALESVAKQLIDATEDKDFGEDVLYLVGCMRTMSRKCRAALAAPPRNCDVGTAEEQIDRFLRFCLSRGCVNCEIGDSNRAKFPSCELAWAQMPYEEGGEK